jgi:hypothetical protein
MRLTIFAAAFTFLLWGTPPFAESDPDFDTDGVADTLDNCSERANPTQDDTDGDDCGNLCDADYDDSGLVNFPDFGAFGGALGTTEEEKVHTDPVSGKTVGHRDWGFFVWALNTVPGPSGTTSGTTACP